MAQSIQEKGEQVDKEIDKVKATLASVAKGREQVDSKEEWKQVRASLAKLGYYRGDLENDDSNKGTRSAVSEYQASKKLRRDGVVGKETAGAMLADLNSLKVPAASNTPGSSNEQQENKIRIDAYTHQRLSNRRIERGETRQSLAAEMARPLAGHTEELVQSGYLQTTPEYDRLRDSSQSIEVRRRELAERKHELQDDVTRLQRRRSRARTTADRRYLGNLVESRQRSIAALDKRERGIARDEDKVQSQLKREEQSLQRQLKQRIASNLPARLIAGQRMNLVGQVGLANLVDKQPVTVPVGTGSGVRTLKALRGNDLVSLAVKKANQYQIPPSLFVGMIQVESRFNREAVSPKGAMGLGQLMPGTATELGVINPYDVNENLTASAKYLKQLYNQFQSWELALAAYNAGPGNVQKYGGIPPFGETQNHVAQVMANYAEIERLGGASFLVPAPPPQRHTRSGGTHRGERNGHRR